MDRTLAGRYQLVRKLGEGGYGVVYEAIDTEWGSPVALKTLQRMDPEALLRFKEEFRALQDVEHPNLVHLGELMCSDGLWFFTMELVEGTDFYDYVRPLLSKTSYLGVRVLEEQHLRSALVQLAEALDAVHQTGRVHCDIKPTNIRVERSGRLVLLDFGLVTVVAAGGVDVSNEPVLGTPGYMAPEQCRGESVTPAADWYAVGVLLYEALTGILPFSGAASQVLLEKQMRAPDHPRQFSPDAPADLCDLCMELLRIDPRERPTGPMVRRALTHEGLEVPRFSSSWVRGPFSGVADSSPFVGRAEELASLMGAFARSRREMPVFVYLSGDSGVGKSALAQRFAKQLGDSSHALILRSRCYERETVPYKAFDGIVDDLARHLVTLRSEACRELVPRNAKLLLQVFPVLSKVPAIADLPPAHAPQDPHVLRSHAFAALREILARLSFEQPLLLLIDDLQWTDLDSVPLLQELLQADDAPLCLVVATGRPLAQLSPDLSDALRPLLESPGGCELPIAGLSGQDAEQLAHALAHDVHDPELLSRIAREAKGHPLFVAELLRHVEAGHALEHPRQLDEALLDRVAHLEETTRELLEILAIASTPTAHGVLAYALHIDPTELGRRLAQLRTSHLARSEDRQHSECYHDRVRQAVLGALSERTKKLRHRALAEALSALGDAEAEQAAYQWHCAGDDARAARYCAQAAEAAERALAFKRAARLYEEALAQPDAFDPQHLFQLRVAHARALSCAGFSGPAAEAYLAASLGYHGEEARALRQRATQLMLRSGRVHEGLALADAVMAELGLTRPTTPTRAMLRLAWERARLAARGLDVKGPVGAPVQKTDESLDLLWAVAPSLAFVDILGGSALQTRYARMALSSGDPLHLVRSLTMEAMLRSTMETPPQPRVVRLLQQVRQVAEGADSPYLRALTLMSHGYVHWVNFRLQEAMRTLAQAERLFRESCVDVAWELTNTRAALLNALWNAGRLAQHAELARDWQRDARDRGDRYAATQLVCMGLEYQNPLRVDEPEIAEQLLQESLRGLPDKFQLPQWSQFIGRLLVGLYRSDVDTYLLLRDTWPQLQRSQLLNASYLGQLSYTDAAWACLHQCVHAKAEARESLLRETLEHARKLQETKRPLAGDLAAQIRAQVCVMSGQADIGVSLLHEAEAGLRAASSIYQYPAAYLLSALTSGPGSAELRERALAWAEGEGIINPDRWFSTFAPALRWLV